MKRKIKQEGRCEVFAYICACACVLCMCETCHNLDRTSGKDLTKNTAFECPSGEARDGALEAGVPECLGEELGDRGCCG